MPPTTEFEKLLVQADILKEANADLREEMEVHELTKEINALQQQVKDLKAKLASEEAVIKLKDKRDVERERYKLLKEILVTRMQESESKEVKAKGKRAVVVQSVKIEKQKGGK